MIWLSLNFDFFIAEPPVFKLQENSTFKSCYFSGRLPSTAKFSNFTIPGNGDGMRIAKACYYRISPRI
jgi:hypothetical protein